MPSQKYGSASNTVFWARPGALHPHFGQAPFPVLKNISAKDIYFSHRIFTFRIASAPLDMEGVGLQQSKTHEDGCKPFDWFKSIRFAVSPEDEIGSWVYRPGSP